MNSITILYNYTLYIYNYHYVILLQVFARAKLTADDEAGVELFTCYGHDPISKGSAFLRTGAIIGVPPTFYYSSPADIDKEKLCIGRKHIDWDTPVAKRLAQSVVLSDKAKAFGIARELMNTCSYHVYINGGLQSLFTLAAFSGGFYMNRKFFLRERMKMWGRLGIYGVLGVVSYTMYMLLSDTYNCFRENSADRRAARLGWAYAEGGVEFYSKALERNKALRELMGAEGSVMYTLHGNKAATLRNSTVQLTERKNAVEKYLLEFHEKEEKRQKEASTKAQAQ